MNFAPVSTKRSRHERKQAQRQQQDPQWRAQHPVSAGVVKVEAYVPPRGGYQRTKGDE